MKKKGVNIYSEIGKLNRVMLHRLGREVEGLVPDNFERLLFDDIPYLKKAQFEHDCFADLLRVNGVEVVYLQEEVEKALADKEVRARFVSEFLNESELSSPYAKDAITEYLMAMPVSDMVEHCMRGILKSEISVKAPNTLLGITKEHYPYYTDPMPNLYFTRDPGACIGNGVSIHRMSTVARRRESLMLKYVFEFDKDLMPDGTALWYEHDDTDSVEGGDILVLSPEIVAIGLSQRTSAGAISKLAERILSSENSFKKIIVLDIPKCRAFMHLDTVFTMVDYDKFTIHPEIEGPLNLYEITLAKDGALKFNTVTDTLTNLLKAELKLPAVQMIRCGGDDNMAAQREQWNDGSNTLAIAPGAVVTYDRNYITNEILEKYGVTVMTIPSSELSRGRGGPRCMSMPIHRD